jgi:hypothetical protein
MPATTGAAFVVILHLDPEHRSDLSSILADGFAVMLSKARERSMIVGGPNDLLGGPQSAGAWRLPHSELASKTNSSCQTDSRFVRRYG